MIGFPIIAFFMSDIKKFPSKALLKWHQSIDRSMPWKETDKPYFIYVSEIILQQTRVAQGTPYYLKFVERFPTIHSLANAEEDDLMGVWKGLGYYSRARNMHKAAKIIVEEYDGLFPDNYDELIKLPGVGPYTAAAISSFAFKESKPVVDGNIIRLISRLKKIKDLVENGGRKKVLSWSEKWISSENPDLYNQAMMDLGALVCLPTKPQCNVCPLKTICKAYRDESQEKFPRKKAKAPKRNRYFHFLKITDGRTLILEKRNQKDIWQGLYQMPLIEKSNFSSLNPNEIQAHFLLQAFKHIDISAKIVEMKQTLSHQIIQAKIYTILINSLPEDISKPFYLVNQENLNNYALPKILDWYFDEK